MYVAEVLLNAVLLLLLIWIAMFVVILAHEAGHALMYRILFRARDWHITVGTGRLILSRKRFTLRAFMITGFCRCPRSGEGSRCHAIMVLLGGPLANVCLLVLLMALSPTVQASEMTLWRQNLAWLMSFAALVNVFQLIAALLPVRLPVGHMKHYVSDGMRIMRIVK